MNNVKDDKYYLNKIICDLKFVVDRTSGMTIKEIEENALLIDSIMFRIIQIAENTNKLTEKFKITHKEVPWIAIKGMRNRIVHDYGMVNLDIIYDTLTNGIPQMYEKLIKIQ